MVQTDAVSFRNAFCQNPVCTPSRCSFMTGWYPHVRGHRTMFHMMRPDEPVLLKTLKENGYFVWWGGKNDLVPGQNGYDDYCESKYRPPADPDRPMHPQSAQRPPSGAATRTATTSTRSTAVASTNMRAKSTPTTATGPWSQGAIELIKNADPDQPLCIYLPLGYPHPPYAVEDPWYSRIDRDALPPRIPPPEDWAGKPSLLEGIAERQNLQGWTEERWTELRATYYGMCARVDHQFGLCWTRCERPASTTIRPSSSSRIMAISPATTVWWKRRRTRSRTA